MIVIMGIFVVFMIAFLLAGMHLPKDKSKDGKLKTKLLKRLRERGRNQIHINWVETTGNRVSGMSIGYSDNAYSGLFNPGDTEEEVLKKAEHIFISKYLKEKNK